MSALCRELFWQIWRLALLPQMASEFLEILDLEPIIMCRYHQFYPTWSGQPASCFRISSYFRGENHCWKKSKGTWFQNFGWKSRALRRRTDIKGSERARLLLFAGVFVSRFLRFRPTTSIFLESALFFSGYVIRKRERAQQFHGLETDASFPLLTWHRIRKYASYALKKAVSLCKKSQEPK